MKKTSLIMLAFCANTCIFFLSCNTSGNSNCTIDSLAVYQQYKVQHSGSDTEINNVSNNLLYLLKGSDSNKVFAFDAIGDGNEVDTANSNRCLRNFKTLLTGVGFSVNPPPARPPAGYKGQLTQSESFKSDEMVKWLNTAKANGADEIRLCFGRYDDSFLSAQLPNDASERAKRKDRISVFLYAFKNTTSSTDGSNISTAVGSTAYDLGNLHP